MSLTETLQKGLLRELLTQNELPTINSIVIKDTQQRRTPSSTWAIGTTQYCQPHETNQLALSWGLSVQTPQHGHRHKTAYDHPKSVHNSYATSHHLRKTHCSRGKQPRVQSLIEVHEGTGLDRSATKTTNYQCSTHGNHNTYRLIQTPEFASNKRYSYDTHLPTKSTTEHTKY